MSNSEAEMQGDEQGVFLRLLPVPVGSVKD
jgi:hypothetical protein